MRQANPKELFSNFVGLKNRPRHVLQDLNTNVHEDRIKSQNFMSHKVGVRFKIPWLNPFLRGTSEKGRPD